MKIMMCMEVKRMKQIYFFRNIKYENGIFTGWYIPCNIFFAYYNEKGKIFVNIWDIYNNEKYN